MLTFLFPLPVLRVCCSATTPRIQTQIRMIRTFPWPERSSTTCSGCTSSPARTRASFGWTVRYANTPELIELTLFHHQKLMFLFLFSSYDFRFDSCRGSFNMSQCLVPRVMTESLEYVYVSSLKHKYTLYLTESIYFFIE